MDMDSELSPKDILHRAAEAGLSLTAIRIVTNSVQERDGEREEEGQLEIRVGENSYRKDIRTQEEKLRYHRSAYRRRGGSGPWRRVPTVSLRLESTGPEPELASDIFGFAFGGSAEFERLPDETVDGRALIHLTTESTHVLPSLDASALKDKMTSAVPAPIPEAFEEHFLAQLARVPNRFSATTHFWIGAEDFLVYRREEKGTLYREDKEVGWFHKTADFSDFSSPLDLPGPLPEL